MCGSKINLDILVAATIYLLLPARTSAETSKYDGLQVWRVVPRTEEEVNSLESLHDQLDFWTDPAVGGPTDMMVQPGSANDTLFQLFHRHGMEPRLLIGDVASLVEAEPHQRISVRRRISGMNWKSYQSSMAINKWLDDISQKFPALTKVFTIGKSSEGRPLKLIQIGTPDGPGRKKAFWIDGGFHAREWISPAVVTWFIHELLANHEKYKSLLNELDFYILPLANPDGYEFSRKGNRFWRKTRSRTSKPRCLGVDLNRNFNFHWNGPGNSANPCSEIYKGPEAFSEPEGRAMSTFIAQRNVSAADWKIYTSIHSYLQVILTPWGHTNQLPQDYSELKSLGLKAATAIAQPYNTKYRVGSVPEIFYLAAGASDDWAKGSGFFKYSYTIEVRDLGRYGFLLPPSFIVPTAEETWRGIMVMANHVI